MSAARAPPAQRLSATVAASRDVKSILVDMVLSSKVLSPSFLPKTAPLCNTIVEQQAFRRPPATLKLGSFCTTALGGGTRPEGRGAREGRPAPPGKLGSFRAFPLVPRPPGPAGNWVRFPKRGIEVMSHNWLGRRPACPPSQIGFVLRILALWWSGPSAAGPNWVCLTRPTKVRIGRPEPRYPPRNAGRNPTCGLLS
jgi:hypothetical protein